MKFDLFLLIIILGSLSIATEQALACLAVSVQVDSEYIPADGKTAAPVTAIVSRSDGGPLSGFTVDFSIISGTGFLSPAFVVTDSAGHARTTYYQPAEPSPSTVSIKAAVNVNYTFTGYGRLYLFGVFLDDVRLPNNFIAIPDKVTHNRIGSAIDQKAVTEAELMFSVQPDGLSVSALKAELTCKKNGKKITKDLSILSGASRKEKVELVLSQSEFESDGNEQFEVKLLYSVGSCLNCESNIVTEDARRLLYDLNMSPAAYKSAEAVCPYTHERNVPGQDLLGIPMEKFWGVLLSYGLGGSLKGYDANWTLNERIHGSAEGLKITVAGKDLNVLKEMKLKGADRKAKWEGYESGVDEPAGEPYHYGFDRQRSENIARYYEHGFTNKVPDNVQAEGGKPMGFIIKAVTHPDPNEDLKQEHEMTGIPVYFRYDYRNLTR